MYKSKVWVHRNVEEILSNKGPYYIDYTFLDEPQNGNIIKVNEEMTEDISAKNFFGIRNMDQVII